MVFLVFTKKSKPELNFNLKKLKIESYKIELNTLF